MQLLLWQTNNYSSIQRFILTTKDSSGVGVTVEATIFHAVQRACTLSNGFVLLSLVSLRHSKFRNYNTLFKIQEKWRNILDRCDFHKINTSVHVTNSITLFKPLWTYFRSPLSMLMRVFRLLGNEPSSFVPVILLHSEGPYYHYQG